jgi:hypothetical protein
MDKILSHRRAKSEKREYSAPSEPSKESMLKMLVSSVKQKSKSRK